jgi:hypothetical protein
MADVPRVLPVDVFAGFGRLAMAGATEIVETGGVENFGIEELRMIGAGAVAGFTLDAELGGLDALLRGESELAGGVALEAAEDLRAGVEDAVLHAFRVRMSGG